MHRQVTHSRGLAFISLSVTLQKHIHVIYRFISKVVKLQIIMKNFDIFLLFAQNIDCVYTLEPPRQSMFWSKNRKK